MLARATASTLAILLVAATLAPGCSCGRKTDEELLRERIDVTSVRVYLTIKTAITQASGDRPEVTEARTRILRFISAWQAAAGNTERPGADLAELASLAKALWDLRALGGELLEADTDSDLPPILPGLLTASGADPALAARLDGPTEHGLLLTAFWALKIHPRSPVPVPQEVLLYEAWKTDPDGVAIPGAGPWLHAMRAWIFGFEALCDLAARDAAAIPADGDLAAALMSEGLPALGARSHPMAPEGAARLTAALRGLGHGSAGLCYLQRDQEDEAAREIQALVDAAEDAGVPPTETALARAWLAYRDDDIDRVKACLDERLAADLTDEERETLAELRGWFEQRDDGALAEYFDTLFFARMAADLAARELERSGALDAASAAPIVSALRAFSELVGHVIGAPDDAVESLKRTGQGLLDQVTPD